MSNILGEAFVRVRPETSGFEHEAEPGIKSAFSHLAKIAAAAFAVEQSFEFGRDIITGAADVQKQIEGVRDTFGEAADELLHFNEGLAGTFGVSARVADQASATFGRLFSGLGIGQGAAAQMTEGFEQLAGALASIRNVDPRTFFDAIPAAVSGNIRVLRQFGVITDSASIKIAAFKLGLTDTITQALTPAQRAIAVYSIATAQLPQLLERARRGSHDLADQIQVLRATFDNLKDAAGARLVPAANAVVQFMTRALPASIRVARAALGDLRADISDISDFIRPALEPFIAEFDRVKRAFQSGGIAGAIGQIKEDLLSLRPAAIVAAAAIAGIGIAFTTAFVAEAPLTALVIAIAGIGIAFREAYDRSARFRDVIHGIGETLESDVIPRIQNVADIVRSSLPGAFEKVRDAFSDTVSFIERHQETFEILGGAIAGAAAGLAIYQGALVAVRGALAAYQAAVKVATAVQLAFDGALIANPIGLIVIAIAALVGALAVLYFRSEAVRRVVNGAFDGLRDGARAAIPLLRTIAGDAADVADSIRSALEPIGRVLVRAFEVAVAIVRGLWQRFGGNIVAIIRNDFTAIVGVVRAAMRVVQGIIDVVTGLITGDWGKVWDGLKNIVGGAFDGIIALAKGFAGNLHEVFDAMWRGIAELFLRGIEKIVGLLAAIPSVHAKIPGVGTVGFTNPFKGADEDLKAAIDGLAHNSKRAVDQVGETVKGAAADAGAKAAHGIAEANANVKKARDDAVQDVVGRGADSAEAAALAAKSAGDAVDAALSNLNTKLNRTVNVNDAQIAKLRAKVRDIGTQIADALKQETKDVQDAVVQAEQNLNSIGQTLSQTIGQVIDKPLQDLQNSLSRQGNKDALEQLRQSVLLPGGKQLSTDPTKALAQLRSISAQAGNVNRLAINDFIRQYQGAVLSVKQDQANIVKEGATRRISDLTDAFNNGKISLAKFKQGILGELRRDRVGYRQAGSLLGTAFENGFRAQVKGLFDQAGAIAATPSSFRVNVNALAPSIVKPLETLRESEKNIAKLTHQKMDAQTALQRRIAKAAEQQAAILAKIAGVQVNPNTPTQKNPGRQQQASTTYNKTTG